MSKSSGRKKGGYTRQSGGGPPAPAPTGTPADDIIVKILPSQPDNRVHPAQHFDFDSDWMSFGFSRTIQITDADGKKTKKKVLCLITNGGEVIPCIPSELEKRGITLAASPMYDEKRGNRISGSTLDTFIRTKGKKPVPWKLDEWLEFVVTALREVIDYENDDLFYYNALWMLFSYCHRVFESLAYMFYHGPTSTGKTRALEVLAETAFNAILSPSMSPSSLFRSVESMAPTLLMDETEKLKDKDKEAENRGLVLSGYKKGANVTRSEPTKDGGFIVKQYATYSPKAFANISGLDDVLGNRCIPILMRRAMKGSPVLTAKLNTRKRKRWWIDIKDNAYLIIFKYWKRIVELSEEHADVETVEGIVGRPLELWNGIFVLAELFESNGSIGLQDKMHKLAGQHVKDLVSQFEQSTEGSMIFALRQIMLENPKGPFREGWYRFQELKMAFGRQVAFAEEGLSEAGDTVETKVKVPHWVRPSFLFTHLRKLGIKVFKGSGSKKQFSLCKAQLVDLWERYMGEWEEPKMAGQQSLDADYSELAHADESADADATQTGLQDTEANDTEPSPVEEEDAHTVTHDLIIEVMLDRTQWTWEQLRVAVEELGYDGKQFDEVFEKQFNKDPRIVIFDGPEKKYGLTDAYVKMRRKSDAGAK